MKYREPTYVDGVFDGYIFEKNLQGDIVAIYDLNTNKIVEYKYDAWGNFTVEGTAANTIGILNPFRYRGYYYDNETNLYYLQSRYYNSCWSRFINADELVYLGVDGDYRSYNLFIYSRNNPITFTDHSGYAPTWWQWAVSGAMVVAGTVLVATGVGGIVGGTLICAGVNSIIGSYTSEAAGGSSLAGWAGGMITGAFCGAGASIAGNLIISASASTGLACIGNMAAGGMIAFGAGATGSAAGQLTSAAIDRKELDASEVVATSVFTGLVNCFGGIGNGMSNAIQTMPKFTATSVALAQSLTTAWTLFTEAICDFVGTIPSLLP